MGVPLNLNNSRPELSRSHSQKTETTFGYAQGSGLFLYKKMKIAFLGLGKAGKRNYNIIKEIYGKEHELLHFPHPIDWKNVDKTEPQIAFIANPTSEHIDTGIECAKRNMHLFTEKPLDCKLDKLDELLTVVNEKKLTAYIAYPYRHHPKIQLAKNIKFTQNTRATIICETDITRWGSDYSWRAETGGGVLWELSHEIDYAEYLFGNIKNIEGTVSTTGKNDTHWDIEDKASLKLTHQTGIVSCLFLSLSSKKETRTIYLENNDKNIGLKIDLLDKKDMYERQILYFFDNLDNPKLTNNLSEAGKLFRKIIKFKES